MSSKNFQFAFIHKIFLGCDLKEGKISSISSPSLKYLINEYTRLTIAMLSSYVEFLALTRAKRSTLQSLSNYARLLGT